MAQEATRIDVLMPVFNEASFVTEALSSIMNWEYPDNCIVNVIVVDDQSTDGTLRIVREFQTTNPRCLLTVLQNPEKGKNNAFNTAFGASSGDYIAFMGGDDLLVPSVLVERATALVALKMKASRSPFLGVSLCKIRTFSSMKKYDGILIPRKDDRGSPSGGSIMLSRDLAYRIFPLPNHLPNEDTWAWLYLNYADTTAVHLTNVGLHYRIHEGNSHKRTNNFSDYRNLSWNRSRAYLAFYAKEGDTFTPQREIAFLRQLAVEIMKYVGWGYITPLLRGLPLKARMKTFAQSTRIGFTIRHALFRFVTGR